MCQHDEILFVPQIADRDDDDVVRPLVVHVVHLDYKDVETGVIQAYICRRCGYTQLYTKEAHQLPVDKIPGAKVLTSKKK
jgi:hypothetical protein